MIDSVLRRSAPAVAIGVVIGVVTLSTCGSDEPAGDARRFCGEVDVHKAELTNPDFASSEEIEPFLQLYRDIGELAPLAIEEQWDQLIVNYETASTVVPGDDESEQRAIVVALQTEKSALDVRNWLRENCAVDLGPIATVAPQDG